MPYRWTRHDTRELTPPVYPDAACRGRLDLDWHPDDERSPEAAAAVKVCCTCPRIDACAAYALDRKLSGIWGGLRTDQRRAMGA